MNITDVLKQILTDGLIVELDLRAGLLLYRIKTGMKSDLYFYSSSSGESLHFITRYSADIGTLRLDDLTPETLSREVAGYIDTHCWCGREYCGCQEFLAKHGFLEKVVTTAYERVK